MQQEINEPVQKVMDEVALMVSQLKKKEPKSIEHLDEKYESEGLFKCLMMDGSTIHAYVQNANSSTITVIAFREENGDKIDYSSYGLIRGNQDRVLSIFEITTINIPAMFKQINM